MERVDVQRYIGHLSFNVRTPTLKLQQIPQIPSSPIQQISLKFRIQIKCCHIQLTRNNLVISIVRHKFRELPFAIDQLPIDILRRDDGASLQQYLSSKFQNYRDFHTINLKSVADGIKEMWVQTRENQALLNAYDKVFPLTVTLKVWYTKMIYVRRLGDGMTITATRSNNRDIETTMLRKVKLEEIEADRSCVICLEELERSIVKMPCLHVFHENCIYKWLENKPSCPLCRFQMPTK